MGYLALVDEIAIGRAIIVVKCFEWFVGEVELIAVSFEKGTGKRACSSRFSNACLVERSVWEIQAVYLAVLWVLIFDKR